MSDIINFIGSIYTITSKGFKMSPVGWGLTAYGLAKVGIDWDANKQLERLRERTDRYDIQNAGSTPDALAKVRKCGGMAFKPRPDFPGGWYWIHDDKYCPHPCFGFIRATTPNNKTGRWEVECSRIGVEVEVN